MTRTIGLSCILALLAAFASGVTIQCTYRGAYVGQLYSCDATVINPENPTLVTEISGTHGSGKTNADVRALYMASRTILTEIPKGFETFPNLQVFTWNGGILTKIDSSIFKPFPNLELIALSGNRIETLDGNLFEFTRKLQRIDFDNNLIQHVGPGILTGLYNLTYASLQNNPCTKYPNSQVAQAAQTPFAVQTLNLNLPIICPPTALPKLNECPISCKLNEVSCKLDEVIEKIAKLEK